MTLATIVKAYFVALQEAKKQALASKGYVHQQAEKAREQVAKNIDKMLWQFAEDPKFQKLALEGPREEQERRLANLRQELEIEEMSVIEKSASEDLKKAEQQAKAKIPSAQQMWNKRVENYPGYVMYDTGTGLIKTSQNRDPYAGLSDSEVREAKKRQVAQDLRKKRLQHLERLEKGSRLSLPSPAKRAAAKADIMTMKFNEGATIQEAEEFAEEFLKQQLNEDHAHFMSECIRQHMEEDDMTREEAEKYCEGEEERMRAIEEDYESKVPKAKDAFDKMMKQKKKEEKDHWKK